MATLGHETKGGNHVKVPQLSTRGGGSKYGKSPRM